MKQKILLLLALLLMVGCGEEETINGVSIPSGRQSVLVVANTSLIPWLNQAAADFNAQEVRVGESDPLFVVVEAVEAGQAVVQISQSPTAAPALWIPDDAVWADLLAEQGVPNYRGACQSVAESPLVIAMWRPIAEALGWPGRELGWLDIGSIAADPTAWAYYSGGQYDENLRLGHTHPGLSATGASTLLAIVQAAEGQATAVSVANIQQPIVQASVGAFEAAVTWFSPSTAQLGQTMSERGLDYLDAAVMYESTAVQFGQTEPTLVPIYPFEGTFVATHPACLNSQATAAEQSAATAFRDYLLSEAGQQTAVANGLRPVNPAVSFNETALLGLDAAQPAIRFAPPTAATLLAVQDVWQAARKPINLVMLLDTSGSMRGDKMESMQAAAVSFVEQMGDEDTITLITFASTPTEVVSQAKLGTSRAAVISAIQRLIAQGNTTLYDAIGEGGRVIGRTTSSSTSNVLIVLSDGEDTASIYYSAVNQELIDLATANNTTIFTIAYGDDAEVALMQDLARRANGNYYAGDTASIALIYEEMSAAFGGSVGIGR